MPLLAGMALYHFTLSIRLSAQTICRYCSCSTDLLSLHPWGSCVFGKKLHPSLLISFLELLPYLPLIVLHLKKKIALLPSDGLASV